MTETAASDETNFNYDFGGYSGAAPSSVYTQLGQGFHAAAGLNLVKVETTIADPDDD